MNKFSVLTNEVCTTCGGLVKRMVMIAVVGHAETLEAHCTGCGKDCIKIFYPSDD